MWELQTLLLERGISIVILAMNMSDSLTIADRVIRISRVDGKMTTKEFTYNQFSELPMSLPWVGFFDELKITERKCKMEVIAGIDIGGTKCAVSFIHMNGDEVEFCQRKKTYG